ncbi:hypothetical protein LENED_005089 [Lentinula edodes]|uniref:Uncharacterized protein n=1 Tax=Lentinula edodes TaxID=5353 RepID=A0A1Q3E7Y4_LENED|nr:hypothetical protein LENED_005089 [Lentinula edodes]
MYNERYGYKSYMNLPVNLQNPFEAKLRSLVSLTFNFAAFRKLSVREVFFRVKNLLTSCTRAYLEIYERSYLKNTITAEAQEVRLGKSKAMYMRE